MHMALEALGRLDQVAPLQRSPLRGSHSETALYMRPEPAVLGLATPEVAERGSEERDLEEQDDDSQGFVGQSNSDLDPEDDVIRVGSTAKNALVSRPEFEDLSDSEMREMGFETNSAILDDSSILRDSVVLDEEVPTVSQLHRAVERRSRSKLTHPVFLCLVCFSCRNRRRLYSRFWYLWRVRECSSCAVNSRSRNNQGSEGRK